MSLARYALVVLAVVTASLGAAAPFLEPDDRRAAVYGGAVAAANTLTAHFLALWSARRSLRVFLWAVLGGMLGRMAVMLAAVAVAILALDLPRVALAVSLLGYFLFFLVFELTSLHRGFVPAQEAR